MKVSEAIEILRQHNLWRRGADIPMENPTTLGIAIDTVVEWYQSIDANKNVEK